MKTIEETFMDKSEWGEGEWQNEPDKLQYEDEATGLPCLIARNDLGSLCGYVGVSKGHPLYRRSYIEDEGFDDLDVHGGITYTDKCQGHICHTVEPGEDSNVWWIGFDCAHGLYDVIPLHPAMDRILSNDLNRAYRTISYVKRENASLAKQLDKIYKRPHKRAKII